MDLELVLSLTGLLLVTGWIPGEGLGCKVTRPIVELDALHTFHSDHRENFRVCTVVGICFILDCLVFYIYGLMCSPWITFATICGLLESIQLWNI